MSQIPLGDFGDPIDIAEVAAFLASKRYSPKSIPKLKIHRVHSEGPNISPVPHSMSMVDLFDTIVFKMFSFASQNK